MALNFPIAPTLLQEYVDENSQVWVCGRSITEGDIIDAWTKETNMNLIYNVIEDPLPILGEDLDQNGFTIDRVGYNQRQKINTIDGQTCVFDFADGDVIKVEPIAGGTMILEFKNFPTGRVCFAKIHAKNWGAATIQYPAAVVTDGGVEIAYSSGTDILSIIKDKNDIYHISLSLQNVG